MNRSDAISSIMEKTVLGLRNNSMDVFQNAIASLCHAIYRMSIVSKGLSQKRRALKRVL